MIIKKIFDMNISFSGNHKSISSFIWNDVAPLSIITGLNGAGKSQLLQVINDQYNQAVNNRVNKVSHGIEPIFDNHDFRFDKISHGPQPFGNLYDSDNSVSYSDLKAIVETLYIIKHPKLDAYGRPQEQQPRSPSARSRFRQIAQNKAGKIWDYLIKTIGKPEMDITPEEIAIYLPEQILFEDNFLIDSDSLGFIFFMYSYKKVAKHRMGMTATADVLPPWQILNEAIEASNLPYRLSAPDSAGIEAMFRNPLNESIDNPFKVKITHSSEGYELGFGDLSSGEKIIMSLAILLYYSKERGVEQEILLLDEPDAHLHPSMTKQFFKVIYDVLVKRHGVTVIMTTHSPSTVALAPEGNDCVIYELRKKPTTVTPIASREEAINSLTEGMVLGSVNSR